MASPNRVYWCNPGYQPVHFGFCPSYEAWKHELKKSHFKDASYPTTTAACTMFEADGSQVCLVTLREEDRGRDIIEIVGLIAHEAMHIWQFSRENIGEENPSPELEAYMIQGIVTELLNAMRETIGLPK